MQLTLPTLATQNIKPKAPEGLEKTVDSFAGFGGASTGIEAADGYAVDMAINHNPDAIELHQINHPNTQHALADIFAIEPLDYFLPGEVGLLWASPNCTHFSRARGSRPKKKSIRGLANRVLYWEKQVRPRVIILENVQEFQTWCRLDKRTGQPDKRKWGEDFYKFIRRLQQDGYDVEWNILNAADYGSPTSRRRLFLIARCDGEPIVWPEPTHGPGRAYPYHTAAECIDFSKPCPSIFTRKKPLADNTARRIVRGIQKFVIEADEPFLIAIDNKSSKTGSVYSVNEPLRTITQENRFALASAFLAKNYTGVVGSDLRKPLGTITAKDHHSLVTAIFIKYYSSGGQYQPVDRPLDTITAKARFGLVTIQGQDYQIIDIGLRMLTPAELLRAQFGEFAKDYVMTGTQSRQVAGIGNSVPPHIAKALVEANFTRRRIG